MRILLFVVNCVAALILSTTGTSAIAQQRNADRPSQRILSLPESELSSSQTQMELLKRLRSLVAGNDDDTKDETANSEDSPSDKIAPKFDEQQLEQLQQALKKLQDQLPPGIKPPELDSIPKEQLDQAMSNPAVQQQLKRMLEQFSKDGLLPKTDKGSNRSQVPPIPRPNGQMPKPAEPQSPFDPPSALEPRFLQEPESASRTGSEGQQDSQTPNAKEPQQKPAEKSWQSLKDAMKKLADIAQGQKKTPQDSRQNNGDAKSPDSSYYAPNNPDAPRNTETNKPKSSPDSSPDSSSSGRPGSNRTYSNPRSQQPNSSQPEVPQPEVPQPGGSSRKKSNAPPSPNGGQPNRPIEFPPQIDRPAIDDSEQDNPEKKEQSLKTLQDLLERFKNSQRDQPNAIEDEANDAQGRKDNFLSDSETHDESMPPTTYPVAPHTQNQNPPGSRPAPAADADASKRILRRPDRSTPAIPPAGTVPQTSQPNSSQQGEVFPPNQMPLSPRDVTPRSFPSAQNPSQPPSFQSDQVKPRTDQSSQKSPESNTNGLYPSISEFIKEQMRDGFPTPAFEDGVAKSNTSPPNARSLDMNAGSSQSRGAGRGNSSNRNPGNKGNARNGSAPSGASGIEMNKVPPDLDVLKELENRGLRGTFEKIVQKVKEESRAKQQQEAVAGQPGMNPTPQMKANEPSRPLDGTQTPIDPGMQKSLGDLLSGLDSNLQDIAKDAKFNEQPSNNSRPHDSSWQSPPPKSDSSLGKIRDAASGFFSDLSKAPQAPAVTPPSFSGSGGSSAFAADAPLAVGSFFMVACVLVGVGGLIAYLMRKPLLKLVTDATGGTKGHSTLQPNEIRSRADIIAAFHDLALSPRQAVESWWTHRAAARKLADGSPHSKHAVDTLTEIYEQARYLPDDVEFAADKIQSARAALAECR